MTLGLIDIDKTFLPVSQMRQISRITTLDGPLITGEVDLESHWVYAQHFPDDPIFPGSLLTEAAGQLVALWAWAAGHRGRPRLVKIEAQFRSPVCDAAGLLVLQGEVRCRRNMCFGAVSVQAASVEVATVRIVLAVLSDQAAN
jgi:3-hydroxymyristoyl/3-hydroxydecanoyl-(acyl carrier protein) dehydratase